MTSIQYMYIWSKCAFHCILPTPDAWRIAWGECGIKEMKCQLRMNSLILHDGKLSAETSKSICFVAVWHEYTFRDFLNGDISPEECIGAEWSRTNVVIDHLNIQRVSHASTQFLSSSIIRNSTLMALIKIRKTNMEHERRNMFSWCNIFFFSWQSHSR